MTTASLHGRDDGLLLAAEKAGGMAALAQMLGLHRSAVYQWRRIPVEPRNYVLELERELGVRREKLRPDVYDVPRPGRR